tara:strand:- start:366 stop:554 length:189 start_codon:yes stop_codon:yes gene_type:complete
MGWVKNNFQITMMNAALIATTINSSMANRIDEKALFSRGVIIISLMLFGDFFIDDGIDEEAE